MPSTELIVAGLVLVGVGTVLIATAPQGPPAEQPRRPPAEAAADDDTPVTIILLEFPPEPARMRAGRWTLLTGLALVGVGLVARWV